MEMDQTLYPMIFKRKSFHLFKDIQSITHEELACIEDRYRSQVPLVSHIRTDMRIVPAEETTCKRGEEYCILLYSEEKGSYLQNIGYIGEQLELCLEHEQQGFARKLYLDESDDLTEKTLTAEYRLFAD